MMAVASGFQTRGAGGARIAKVLANSQAQEPARPGGLPGRSPGACQDAAQQPKLTPAELVC